MQNGASLLRKREYQFLGPPSTPLSAESRIATRGQDRQKRLKVRASILGPSPTVSDTLLQETHTYGGFNQPPLPSPSAEQLARAERNRLAALEKLKSQQRPVSTGSFRNWRTPNAMDLEEEMKHDPFFSRGRLPSPTGLATPLRARPQEETVNPAQIIASQSSSQPWISKPVIIEDDLDDQQNVVNLSDSDGFGAQPLATPVNKHPTSQQPILANAPPPLSPPAVASKTPVQPTRKYVAIEPVPFGKISEKAIAEANTVPVEQQLSPFPPGFETISSRKLRHLLFRLASFSPQFAQLCSRCSL